MMTMAVSTADDDPPRTHNNLIYTTTPSTPLQESIALKDGTCGNDSPRYYHPTVLREIPTRISPSPTAAVVDCHDANRQPHQHCPDFPHPQNKPNSVPQFLSSEPTTDDYVDRTLNKINKLMRSWPSVIAPTAAVVVQHNDDTDCPSHQTRPDLTDTQNEPNSVPQFLSPQPTTDDYVDRTLDKINKMMSSWPSATACE